MNPDDPYDIEEELLEELAERRKYEALLRHPHPRDPDYPVEEV